MLWDQNFWQKYGEEVHNIREQLTEGMQGLEDANADVVAEKSKWLGEKLAQCTHKTFGPHGARDGRRVDARDWWDGECEELKLRVWTERDRCLALGLEHDPELRSITSIFKSTIRRKRREFQARENQSYLLSMRKNPKAFWSKIRGPIEKAELTDCEGAVNYFSTLLNVEHSITDIQPTGEPSCSDLGEPLASLSARLNEPFTEAEVGAALGSLSNAKSTSDQLPSELFKYAKVQDPTTGTWNNVVVRFPTANFESNFCNGYRYA